MAEFKKKIKKFQLALVFASIVFLIFLMTIIVIFIGIVVLDKLGLTVIEEHNKIPLFTLALVSLVIGTVCAFIFSKRPLKPIRALGKAADKIAAGDYSTRVELKGPDEIVQLGQRFNHMAEELSSVEMLRSDFVNNFSHEFKTPLTQ